MKKRNTLKTGLLAALCLFGLRPATTYAQSYEKLHLVGEHLSNFSITERCCQQPGYVVAGTRGQNQEIQVTAMDVQGNPIWSRSLNNDHIERVAHIEAVEEGYALTGFIRGAVPSYNKVFFILLDPSGNVVVSKMFYNPNMANWHLQGTHVLEVKNDEGYLLTGYFMEQGVTLSSDKYVMALRLDDNGDLIWGKIYNSPNDGRADFDMGAFALQVEKNFYITGSSNVTKGGRLSTQGVLSMMIDDNGDVLWSNNFALDPDTDYTNNADLGTSALYDENEDAIVLSANTTLSTNFYLTKIDPSLGSIINQKAYNLDDDYTPSYYIGQNTEGNYVVSGLIKSAVVRYDCNGVPEEGTVPYIVEIEPTLTGIVAGYKYPMYAPNFSTDDGSVYHSHFGGPANLMRPLINTPEMAFTHKETNRTVLLGYREDGPSGSYDLQFISNQSPTYDWCLKEGMDIIITDAEPYFGPETEGSEFNELDWFEGNPSGELSTPVSDCGSTIPSGSGQFPVVQASTGTTGSGLVSHHSFTHGTNLVVKNGYSYAIGHFDKDMLNPNLSHSNTYPRPWVAKYDVNGNLVWGKKATGTTTHNNSITGIEVDDDGNVYVTGYFTDGYLRFDGDPTNMTASVSSPSNGWSSYVIKFDTHGVFQWRALLVKDKTSFGSAIASIGIDLDSNGDVYITGTTNNYIKFYKGGAIDPFNGGSPYLTTPDSTHHGFIAKYNKTNGQLVFFESQSGTIGGSLEKYIPRAIEVDPVNGEIFLGGETYTASVAPRLIKANTSGIVTGVTGAGSSSNGYLNTVELHGAYAYVGGYMVDSLDFAGYTVTNANYDGWFVRIKKSSLALDASSFNRLDDGAGYAAVTDISLHDNGDAYVYGSFSGTTGTFSNGGGLSLIGAKDLALAKYNTSLSSSSWQENFGGTNTIAYGGAIAEDDINCGSFITAIFSNGSIDLGASSGVISTPTGAADHFIARIDDTGASYKVASQSNTAGTYINNSTELSSEVVEGPTLYPNPAMDYWMVTGLSAGESIDITTPSGELVRSFKAEGETLRIVRGDLPKGLYFVSIGQEESTIVKKILLL